MVGPNDVLVLVDIKRDFCPGGALAVPAGDQIVPVVNRIATRFGRSVLTQDWHPPGHVSFASSHPGRNAFETIHLPYGEQLLWPEHCVQGTAGSAFHPDLRTTSAEASYGGVHREIDSYSAFYKNDHKTPTGLAGYLNNRGFQRVFVVGLATDFCVCYTALDARAAGFDPLVSEDACRAIDLGGSLEAAWSLMESAGVRRIQSWEIERALARR
jgi:nicotinamidase/pyrazinamidase